MDCVVVKVIVIVSSLQIPYVQLKVVICLVETVVLLVHFVLKNRPVRVFPANVKVISAVSKTCRFVLDYVEHQLHSRPLPLLLLLHHFHHYLQSVIH